MAGGTESVRLVASSLQPNWLYHRSPYGARVHTRVRPGLLLPTANDADIHLSIPR